MRRAYSYKRFSSPKQARGDSLRRQSEFEESVVRDLGLLLDDSLSLTDRGVSGFRGDNRQFGALARFLAAVESGKVAPGSVLIVENLDRLSRENVLDAFNLFNRILSAGITIVTATPREVYDRETVSADISKVMVPLVYMMRAHDESLTKSKRVSSAWGKRKREAREKGVALTKRCPGWLRVVDGRYELIPEHAETVRLIYRWTLDGLGLHRVTKKLVEEGRIPFGRTPQWNESYVRKILTTPAVHGEFQPHVHTGGNRRPDGDPLPSYFPVVIPLAKFELVQATVSARRRREGRPPEGDGNLFSGLVYLWGHPERMVLVNSGKSKGRPFKYLSSGNVRRGRQSGERGRSVSYPLFERTVLAALGELRPEDILERRTGESEAKRESLRNRLRVLDHTVQTAEEQMADPDHAAAKESLARVIAKASADAQRTKKELAELDAASRSERAETLGETRSVIHTLDGLVGEERKAARTRLKGLLRWLVEEIRVHLEPVGRRDCILHAQVYLRNGKRLYLVGKTRPAVIEERRYDDVDFRTTSPTNSRGE